MTATLPQGPPESLLDIDVLRAPDGRTRVAALTQQFPQRVTAPMYLDEADRGMAFLCSQNPTGGSFPGDRLRTRVLTRGGSRLHLTGQSATQVYAGASSHRYEFTVAPGALLEHLPKVVIPHAGSEHDQLVRVDVAEGGTFVGWDSVAAGRIGSGERFAYTRFRSVTEVYSGGALAARDVVDLRPGGSDVLAPGALAGRDYLATFFVVTPGAPCADLAAGLHEELLRAPGVLGAVSTLPSGAGLAARLLARRAPAINAALLALWGCARRTLLLRDRPTVRM
ncbi:urease accessory protein UreD [Kineococcus glutinatus]|uniref:Urease accessory protein UreD n=1 Tax=Kineococcus glutinatus TaxID=1070872 RepID=A0ABP9I831_9ACTN